MIPARWFSVNVLTATSSSRAAAVLLIPRDSISDACLAISDVNTTRERGRRGTRNAASPPSRYRFTARRTVIRDTPYASIKSRCDTPLTT